MVNLKRRELLLAGLATPLAAVTGTAPGSAPGTTTDTQCLRDLTVIAAESDESPFFEHYHQLLVPIGSLLNPPDKLVIQTSALDEGSYDAAAFATFIQASHLDRNKLLHHSHAVTLTHDHLKRIANGEKDVEVRVVSPAGNYVHNFRITAYQSTLATLRKRGKK